MEWLVATDQPNGSNWGRHCSRWHAAWVLHTRLVGQLATMPNASNNETMIVHFSRHIEKLTKKPFDHHQCCVRYLAHIVNLATQALISTHSKSKVYNPMKPNKELFADEGDEGLPKMVEQHDEIGLICLISVKEQSSAKRKEVFHKLQREAGMHPCQLLGDIPFVEPFLHLIAGDEKDQKRQQKLSDLIPTKKEWICVLLFLKLLMCAENAQQAFWTDQGLTLHLAIPALEVLHAAWSKCHDQSEYSDFFPALDAAIDKVTEHYDKTAESEVYTFVMCKNYPSKKAAHLHKYWWRELTERALMQAEEMYKAHYIEMYGNGNSAPSTSQKLVHALWEVAETTVGYCMIIV
ncbi:hypothetical protein DXG01_016566 [Tephrocybe rancida]|nr:hypothetical protein DXG01_016566 [Tephrocybe rancida]